MNNLKVEAVTNAFVPFKHLDNIIKVRGFDGDRFLQDMYIFNYGRIIGIREERARRNGNRCKLDAPRLIGKEEYNTKESRGV